MENDNSQTGKLFIVATPIGNYEDITLRALKILQSVDAVACEEYRLGSTLLKKLEIGEKPLFFLNEHNESEGTEDIIIALLSGQSVALISDCGTPSFADPGTFLVKRCVDSGIPVTTIPGASSLMGAISLSPLPLNEFLFAGFLPRRDPERREKLAYLKTLKMPIIIMDTPYRMGKLVNEIGLQFGKDQIVSLAVDLTLPTEALFFGRVGEVAVNINKRKGEFILIVY